MSNLLGYRRGNLDEVRRHRQGGHQGRAAKLPPESGSGAGRPGGGGRSAFRTASEIRQWGGE